MATVKPIPEGYHSVTPQLSIQGAADAIEFYKSAFGAVERGRMPGPKGSIMHAELKIGDSVIMLADATMNPPTQTSLHIYVEDADAAWQKAVAAGAKVEMPLEDAFWGDRYGVLTDKWGNRWSIATHKEDLTEAEMQRRATEAMKQMQ
ncbi:MAG TPA: VOC family protein [Polyangiales bacterium]|nr:VOC family protein [Polyangiales bacterium]